MELPSIDHPPPLIPPSFIDFESSGIIKLGSIFINIPSPVHFLHAPKGLLKENILGVSSPTAILCSGQAKFLENIMSFSILTFTMIIPSEAPAAVSTASVILERSLSLMTILSTTISILCF